MEALLHVRGTVIQCGARTELLKPEWTQGLKAAFSLDVAALRGSQRG